MDIKAVFVHALQLELRESAAEFEKLQNGHRFERLQNAMWALQYVGQRDATELTKATEKVPLWDWPAFFAKIARQRAGA